MAASKRARGSVNPSRARVAAGRVGLRAARGITRRLGVGYDLQPLAKPAGAAESLRRAKLLEARDVTLVLDVGANIGQWAKEVRRAGYAGRMVSFEPLSDAFAKLERTAKRDQSWDCRRVALGNEDGTAVINVAENLQSSSLLAMEARHLQTAPESEYVATEEVPTSRLATLWPELVRPEDRVYLKLDTQGYELEVLRGADAALERVVAVQAELSTVPLYTDAPLFKDLFDFLDSKGYRLAGLEAGHEDDETGELLQVDGIFVRD